MFVWGGIGESGQLNSGGELTFDTQNRPNRWDSVPTSGAPTARASHGLVWTGSKVIVWGGSQGGSYLNTGGVYDPSARSWSSVATTDAPSGRASFGTFWSGKEFVVIGGENSDGALANSFGFDPISNKWRAFSTSGSPSARIGGVGAWSGSEIMVFGGKAANTALASLQKLTPQPNCYFIENPNVRDHRFEPFNLLEF